MTLASVLSRRNNNISLIRLLAATAVIYGHSLSIIPNHNNYDFLPRIIGINSAERGVKIFFFLSGLLVVNSIISDKNVYSYVIKRVMRLWPALAFVIFGTAFVIGPICSKLSISEYFINIGVYDYVRKMMFFKIWGYNNIGLPGVFENNRIPGVANAPLWTLAVEVFAYIFILSLYLIGAFRRRIAIILFLIFIADALMPGRLIFWWLPKDSPDFAYIPFCFAIGGLLAIYKDKLVINFSVVAGFIILSCLLKGWAYYTYLFYTTMFLAALWFSALPMIINLPNIPDISYGVYLWGWPVQQAIVSMFPSMNYWASLVSTYVIVCGIAFISWYLIEQPSIDLGRRLAKRLKRNPTGNFGD